MYFENGVQVRTSLHGATLKLKKVYQVLNEKEPVAATIKSIVWFYLKNVLSLT